MIELIKNTALSTLQGIALLVGITMLVVAAELAFPRGAQLPWKRRTVAVLAWLVLMPTFVVTGHLSAVISHYLGIRPLIVMPTGFLAILAAPLIADFFYYWLHRLQHKIPLLWRFHAVHHSIEEMGAPTGYHHWAEPFIQTAFYVVPLALLMRPTDISLVGPILTMHGFYLHSATKLNFGKLSWLVVDNRTHRVHHSLESHHFDKNFGAFTQLWDILFGTAYFVRPDEWPAVGLDDRSEPKTLWQYVVMPFLSGPTSPVLSSLH